MQYSQYTAISLLTLFAAAITVAAIRLILNTGLVSFFADAPGHRKVHSAPIPRVGGIAMVIAVLTMAFIWYVFAPTVGASQVPRELFYSILAAAVGIGGLGLFDDSKYFNVRVRHKLAVAVGLAVVTVYIFGVPSGAVCVFGLFEISKSVVNIIAVLWIILLINAYNLVDGLDGFAGTITVLSLLGIALVSRFAGYPAVPALAVFTVGAVAGFLAFNKPPAKVFMGDTGSCFLGYMVALLTLNTASGMAEGGMEYSGKALVIMPLLAGIPILEVIVTILRRYFSAYGRGLRRTLKYIGTADRYHLHHRYLLRGFSHLEACILVGTLMATLVGGAVCIVLTSLSYLPWILVYLTIPVMISLHKLGVGRQIRLSILQRPAAEDIASTADRGGTVSTPDITDAMGTVDTAVDVNTVDGMVGMTDTASIGHKFFRTDLMTQAILAVPILILLVYLIIRLLSKPLAY